MYAELNASCVEGLLHLTESMVMCAGATPRAGARVQAPATASRAGLGPAAT